MMRLLILLVILTITPRGVTAEPVRVMVAANFRDCLTELADRYTANTGQEVLLSSGSTGMLFSQVMAGAPCHVFFAADADRPQRLVTDGIAVSESRTTYAIGRLVLWSPSATVPTNDISTAIDAAQLGAGLHLAIANPLHAPYGSAAQQALQATNHWDNVQPFLVKGQSAGQTWQFIYTGAARLGFVSLAQIRAAERADPKANLGQVLIVPATLHEPIIQQAVLLRDAPAAAVQFFKYVQSDEARTILQEFGYEVPTE